MKIYTVCKETLEFVAIVAACVAFYMYVTGADARKRADKLQSLQLSQLCESLGSTIDGSGRWNAQEPRTFDEWDKSNEDLDKRITFLNESCAEVEGYVPVTRVVRGVSVPKESKRQSETSTPKN